jgi:hypothetical protein
MDEASHEHVRRHFQAKKEEVCMDSKALLLTINERFQSTLSAMLGDLTDAQMQTNASAIDERTIAEVALHAYSNLLGIGTVVAGKEWSLEQWPISDWPTHLARPATTAALLTLLGDLHAQARALLQSLPASALDHTVTLPWGMQPGGEAVIDALLHGLHHVDAIGGIRALAGFPTPPDD